LQREPEVRAISAQLAQAKRHLGRDRPALGQDCKDRRLGQIIDAAGVYRHAVACGSPPANSGVEPIDARQVDEADHRLTGDRVGDGDTPQRKPAEEIVGAVDRIDYPAALTGEAAALLPEKAVVRKGVGQPGPDQRLDLAIGEAHEVLRSLGLARQCGPARKMPGREITGLADHRGRGRQTGFDGHGRLVSPLRRYSVACRGSSRIPPGRNFCVVAIFAEAHPWRDTGREDQRDLPE
jgi:hypothetical protein